MADGSIRIDTRINKKGAEQGLEELKRTADAKVKQLESGIAKAGKEIDNWNAKIETTKNKYDEVGSELENVQSQIKKIRDEQVSAYTDSSGKLTVPPSYLKSLLDANTELNELGLKENKLVAESNKLATEGQGYVNKLNSAKSKQEQLNASLKIAKGEQSNVNKRLEESKNKAKQLAENLKKAKNHSSGLKTSSLGISDSIGKGVKKLIRYGAALLGIRTIYSLLSSSASAWLNSGAEGTKQLKADIDSIKVAIGSGLQPVIQAIYNIIIKVLGVVASLIKAFTGVNIFANATKKNLGAATGNAKKLNKELSNVGFDEQEKLQDTSDSSSGGGGAGDLTPSVDYTKLADQFADLVEQIRDAIEKGDWFGVGAILGEKLNEAMDSIPWEAIQEKTREIARHLAEMLNGFMATVNWKKVGKTFAQGLNTVIYFAYEFIKTFDWKKFGSAIADSINGFFEGVDWGTLAQTLSECLIGLFDTATGFLETLDWGIIIDSIITFFQNVDYSGISDAFFEMMGAAVGSLIKLGTVIGDRINEAIDSAAEYFMPYVELCGGNIIEGILLGIVDALISIGVWVREHIFQPFIDGFKEAFGIHSPSTVMAEMGGYIIDGLKNGIIAVIDKITEIWNNMKQTAEDIFNKLKEKLSEIWDNIKEAATTKFNNLKEKATNIFNNVKTSLSNIWNNIKTATSNVVSSIYDSVTNKFTQLKNKVANIFESIKTVVTNVWNGIWNNIKSIANSILGGIERLINGTINGINGLINALNRVSFTAPDWVPGFGGKSFGLNIPNVNAISLPRLAKGGIAMQPTQAIIGEAGKEAVLPLENNKDWMEDMSDIFADKIEEILERIFDNNDGDKPINIYLDGELLQRRQNSRNNRLNLATNGRW